MDKIKTFKMVKGEDLNHHGTLFAGRCAEWFVETSFIAATQNLDPKNVVCLKIYGLEFLRPAQIGTILSFDSQIVHTGKTSLTVYTEVFDIKNTNKMCLDGFVTFCNIDENGKAFPHKLNFEAKTEREKELNKKLLSLLKK